MLLFYCALCFCAAVLLFAVTLIGCRNPVTPFWAGESVVANVSTPLMVGLFALGLAYAFQAFFSDFQPSVREYGYAATVVAVTLVIIMMLRIGKRLAAFARQAKDGEIIPVDFQAGSQAHQDGPVSGNNAPFRKAA